MARRKSSRSRGITPAQLSRSLERGEIAPVYLITGSEEFLRRKAIEGILAAVTSDDEPDLAVERIDGDSARMADILDAARSLPLFLQVAEGPARAVLVSGFDGGDKDDGEMLAAYLDAPVEATCLVLEAPALDKRRAAAKALAASAVTVQCDPPEREADVRRWIENSAQARGFEISPEAIAYLLEMIGLDLQQLSQELDKVELFAAAGGRLEARQLERLLGRSREHSVFELTDALVAGHTDVALRVLNRLLDDGEEPVRILAMVSWVIRQLITARDLSGRGCPERELLQQLGGRWDQRRRVLQKAARSEPRTLNELLVRCARSDATVKMQRGAGSRGTLEQLCRRVCAA
ncbi:MAG: DNA polymerase III subunit delta [Acidobacteriota bacterium]